MAIIQGLEWLECRVVYKYLYWNYYVPSQNDFFIGFLNDSIIAFYSDCPFAKQISPIYDELFKWIPILI